jgi:hypothetical protein
MTNPEAPSTAPVAWCRSDDFSAALQKVQSFSGWREQHPDCDMALYAQPQANAAAPATDQAEGPSLADVAELCAEFEYHIDSDDDYSLGILRDMITAAITRWRAPVAQPASQPVNLAELHDPDFPGGLTPSQHLDVLHGGADPTWQPIETAPRDGTWVLLAGGECESNEESDNRGRVVTAQWTTEYRSNTGDRLIADFGRWEFAYYDSGVYGEYENPTFWQPLPSPPNTPSPHA